ncbi:MAG: hypothetical protein GX490_01410 [Bacilli bacterium]|nr:hypothetical protein [Bacilli bacterium]
MGKYNIAGIKLEFNYCFPDFFDERIKKYEISDDECVNARMNVRVSDCLENIKGTLKRKIKHHEIYDVNGKNVVTTKNIQLIYNDDYSDVEIVLNSALGERLPEIEYIYTGMNFCALAVKRGIFPLHASAIEYNQEAILFSAPSGTGKSTHVNLWKGIFPEIKIINDDKPLVMYENNEFYVSGSPWSGKSILNDNVKVPLKAIVFLRQSPENYVKELEDHEKFIELIRNTYHPDLEEDVMNLLDMFELLIKEKIITSLYCNISEEAVWTIYKRIFGEEK